MQSKQSICLLNDSFPPIIDGVSNTILNYARNIEKSGSHAMVVTPSHPNAEDSKYSFPVIRYPSVNFSKMDDYMAGIPFSPNVAKMVSEQKIDILHSHCPVMSTLLARELRSIARVPLVFTYHTKFDLDIENLFENQHMKNACKKALVGNISSCDEVWTVSKGAGENLRSMGYTGEYIIMPNGVDLPQERVSESLISSVTASCNLPNDIPIYLFVGRMMWYKGIRIICDALAKLKANGQDFRMIFVGEGDDRKEIMDYATKLGIYHKCLFVGAVYDRDKLRAWYCKADLFLFPSTYDTNGLVVREASACELSAVLIKGSCAAEGVSDGINGLLIEENAESLANCLIKLGTNKDKMHELGRNASRDLYISWEASVNSAMERYEIVIERYQNGYYPRRCHPTDGMAKINGQLMSCLAKLSRKK